MHPFEIIHERFFDLPLRFGSKAVDEFKQEIHQDIGQFPPTEETVGGQEGHPERHGMPPEFVGLFHRNPLAVGLEHGRG